MSRADPAPLYSLAEVLDAEHAHLHRSDPSCPPAPARCSHSALCLSGGGIRSASFALGVLQGLARHGVLNAFDYLSTVSGGGFAGGWLTAWSHRAGGRDPNTVAESLAGTIHATGEVEAEPLRQVRMYGRYMSPQTGVLSADGWTLGATILRNLLLNWSVLLPLLAAALLVPRLYAETIRALYLPSGAGAYTAASFVLTVSVAFLALGLGFVGLSLPSYGNRQHTQPQYLLWCHLPMCLGLAGLTVFWAMQHRTITLLDVMAVNVAGPILTAVIVGIVMGRRRWRPRTWLAAGVGGMGSSVVIWWLTKLFAGARVAHPLYPVLAFPLLIVALSFGVVLFVGTGSEEMGDADIEWYSRLGAWHLITFVVWLCAAGIVFGAPVVMHAIRHFAAGRLGVSDETASPLVGIVTSAIATIAGMLVRTLANGNGGEGEFSPGRRLAVSAAAPALLLLLLSLLSWSNYELLVAMRKQSIVIAAAAGPANDLFPTHLLPEATALFAALLGLGLIMGRFVRVNRFSLHGMYRDRLIRAFIGASRPAADRHPDPFTGFDPADDLEMWQLGTTRPMLVANMTLNTIAQSSTSGLHRKAEPFSATPLHVGAPARGYRAADAYGATPGLGQRGLSLGTAVTISGAAASPNMGAFSSPALTFLLTMFNARLGAWMGNPASGDGSWRRSEPKQTLRPLLDELLGRTTDTASYVYLSDGGHFDNLGLWQMVLRRCRYVLVSDAGCDEDYTFADLANAIRQIRIDLGVPIVFEQGCPMDRAHQGNGNPHYAVARILYSAIDGPDAEDGTLVYVKATLSGDEPIDVLNFGKAHPSFPHESTANQWFDEAHFESYRVLGFHSAMEVARGYRGGADIAAFFTAIVQQNAVRAIQPAPAAAATLAPGWPPP